MSIVPIPQLADRDDPGPGWWPATRDGEPIAWMKCPRGHRAALTDHIIQANGMVRPSVVCPGRRAAGETCDYHEFVRLLGWSSPGDEIPTP